MQRTHPSTAAAAVIGHRPGQRWLAERLGLAAALLLTIPLPSSGARAAQAPAPLQVLQQAHWIAEGSSQPRHVLYVFVDANCPFCHRLWLDQQRFYGDGLQVRSLLVALIAPSSAGKAAAILDARNPPAALRANELRWRSRPDGGGGIAPVEPGGAVNQILAHDVALMQALGFQGTPALVWFDARGGAHGWEGAPGAHQLAAIVAGAAAPH